MTDLEITQLCAEAMGWKTKVPSVWQRDPILYAQANRKHDWYSYEPLVDDAQAMALVKKFNLGVGPTPSGKWRAWIAYSPPNPSIPDGDTPARAICECVAKMQKAKEAG